MKKSLRFTAWLAALALLCAPLAAYARYATLEFGSRGADVLKLQKALMALGYDTNGADGKFGRGTESAVKSYQAANGLTADGKAGHLTLTKLYESGAASAGGSASQTATSPNTLKYGDSGSRVTELQTSLRQLGYYTGSVDGRFGAGTQRGVIAFQKAYGLKADGLAGTKTLAMLEQKATSASQSPSTGSASSSADAAGFTRTLRRGMIGQDVVSAQTRLKALGYYTGSIDGEYGSGSILAVKAFQRTNGLKADGLAGRQTWNRLMSASAVGSPTGSTGSAGSAGTSGSTGSTGSTGSGTDASGSSSSGYVKLESGVKGDAVKKLQKALQALNYNVSADGTYGPETISAVRRFQEVNGLTVDGVAGGGTQTLLYSGNAKKNTTSGTSSSTGSAALGTAQGPSGSSIKLLHWYNEVKPSLSNGDTLTVYDPATSLQWKLRVLSRGHHCDSEPITAEDTATMFKAFGNKNTWTAKPVYVKLPNGTWSLATQHNVPHDSQSIKNNDFDGHLCVHFLRDLEECKQNDPNWGMTNQNAIRKAWKALTGITVD